MNFAIPLLLKHIVDALSDGNFVGFYQKKIVFAGIITYSVAWSLTENLWVFNEILIYRITTSCISTYSSRFFQHMFRLPATFHSTIKTGAIVEALFRTQEALDWLYWRTIFSIYPTLAEIITATIIIWYAYCPLYSFVFFAVVTFYTVSSYFLAQTITKKQDVLNEKRMESAAKASDSLLNWQTVYMFGNCELEGNRISKYFDQQFKAQYQFFIRENIVSTAKEGILGIGLLIIMSIFAFGVLYGFLSVGDFVMANAYFSRLVTPLRDFGLTLKEFRYYLNNISNTEEILNIEYQKPCLIELKINSAPAIRFKDVWFSYPFANEHSEYELLHPKRNYAISNVSFSLLPGQTLAIVGHSGSGKSTIAKLLCKLYNPTIGDIYIDSKPLASIDEQSIRSAIAVVSQDFEMFDQTIGYNLLYGKPEATEQELWQAIKKAHLNELVQKLPNGLDTVIGKSGITISGGERQRLAIARAILRKPSIFIFDEPTSALDNVTQNKINQTIKEISQFSTTIIIAHKLSTIASADKIIVLDQGRVVGLGNHKELLQTNEFYKQLFLANETFVQL